MTKCACGNSILPRSSYPPIADPHCLDQLFLKIGRTFFNSGLLMTRVAVSRQRGQLAFLVMTREARRVSQRARLESAFLQPECIADVLWRLRNEFVIGLALRLIRLMAVRTIRIGMLVMGKDNTKLRDEVDAFCR